jgi:hypothetical protein
MGIGSREYVGHFSAIIAIAFASFLNKYLFNT